MENIFLAKDIRDRLKIEYEQFKAVNEVYKEMIKEIKLENEGNVFKYMEKIDKKSKLRLLDEQNSTLARILKEVEK